MFSFVNPLMSFSCTIFIQASSSIFEILLLVRSIHTLSLPTYVRRSIGTCSITCRINNSASNAFANSLPYLLLYLTFQSHREEVIF